MRSKSGKISDGYRGCVNKSIAKSGFSINVAINSKNCEKVSLGEDQSNSHIIDFAIR